ncbi:MAG: hypothetical protein ACPGYX_03145 [Oceanobacter sp.]
MKTLLKLHKVAAILATLMIATFLISSIVAELLSANLETIQQVKACILKGLFFLVPALIATGISGNRLHASFPTAAGARKLNRMKLIAANGLLILVPAAVFLNWKASHGELDISFWSVQVLELVAGLLNLSLMVMNARDGIAMKSRRCASRSSNHNHSHNQNKESQTASESA